MKILVVLLLLAGLLQGSCSIAQQTNPDAAIWVRDGFTLTVAEDSVDSPRFMVFDDRGTLYVSLPGSGEIKSLRDTNNDGYYETVKTFVSGYPTVHGLFFYDGWLWFTQSGAIYKAKDIDHDGVADKIETVIAKGELPEGGGQRNPQASRPAGTKCGAIPEAHPVEDGPPEDGQELQGPGDQ